MGPVRAKCKTEPLDGVNLANKGAVGKAVPSNHLHHSAAAEALRKAAHRWIKNDNDLHQLANVVNPPAPPAPPASRWFHLGHAGSFFHYTTASRLRSILADYVVMSSLPRNARSSVGRGVYLSTVDPNGGRDRAASLVFNRSANSGGDERRTEACIEMVLRPGSVVVKEGRGRTRLQKIHIHPNRGIGLFDVQWRTADLQANNGRPNFDPWNAAGTCQEDAISHFMDDLDAVCKRDNKTHGCGCPRCRIKPKTVYKEYFLPGDSSS